MDVKFRRVSTNDDGYPARHEIFVTFVPKGGVARILADLTWNELAPGRWFRLTSTREGLKAQCYDKEERSEEMFDKVQNVAGGVLKAYGALVQHIVNRILQEVDRRVSASAKQYKASSDLHFANLDEATEKNRNQIDVLVGLIERMDERFGQMNELQNRLDALADGCNQADT